MLKESRNVYLTYNKIAGWFDAHRSRRLMERKYLEFLVRALQPGASVLDVGCGTGEPILRFFVERQFQVTGIDASSAMLDIARTRFPGAYLLECDMRAMALPMRFDAILAWHSFFHLPPNDQRAMFAVFARHMNPGGFLMFTSGPEQGEVWSENGGELLYHASLGTQEYRALLEKHGFRVVQHQVEDADCGGATVWIAQYH